MLSIINRFILTPLILLTDGHQRKVPKIAPIEIAFENRAYVTEAVVSGNEPLLGVIPLEAMDLIVDPPAGVGRQSSTSQLPCSFSEVSYVGLSIDLQPDISWLRPYGGFTLVMRRKRNRQY